VTILKEWRRHGIKDIQVDKKRNIVFGKVDTKNSKLNRPYLLERANVA